MASATPLQLESGSPSQNATSGKKQNEQQRKRPSFGFVDLFSLYVVSRSNLTYWLVDRDMQDLVTFVVGPAKKEFVVHKSFACHTSPILKAAFNSDFIEGQTQRYTLEDTTEGAFRLFSEWVYTQNIYWDGESKDEPRSYWLPEVWVLAEKLLVPKLQNRAIDLIEDLRKKRGAVGHTITWIYQNTPYGSPLRRIYVHQWAWNVQSHIYRRTDVSFPTEFLIELAAYLRDINVQKLEFSRDMKDFYVKEGVEEKA